MDLDEPLLKNDSLNSLLSSDKSQLNYKTNTYMKEPTLK